MTIKNYGLMWERESVRWVGTKGNAAKLMGQGPIGNPIKDQVEVDFREQIGVYILYRNETVNRYMSGKLEQGIVHCSLA